VLCVDEKTMIQALDRTRPLLPMGPSQVERRTHDYVRNGTTDLFAALDVAAGSVIGRFYDCHRAVELLDFLKLMVRSYPRKQLHVVLDKLPHPRNARGGAVAEPTPPCPPSLHAYQRQLDEPGRDLVLTPERERHPAWRLQNVRALRDAIQRSSMPGTRTANPSSG
jgi:hypothetical protein